MLILQAADLGRRCVEVAALLYYYAQNVSKRSWPCILQRYKSRIIVDVLLYEESMWQPLSMDRDWFRKKGLYLVDTPNKVDLHDENWAYVTKATNVLAIRKYQKRVGDWFLKFQPFATNTTHEFWKQTMSSQSDSDILCALADLADISQNY